MHSGVRRFLVGLGGFENKVSSTSTSLSSPVMLASVSLKSRIYGVSTSFSASTVSVRLQGLIYKNHRAGHFLDSRSSVSGFRGYIVKPLTVESNFPRLETQIPPPSEIKLKKSERVRFFAVYETLLHFYHLYVI